MLRGTISAIIVLGLLAVPALSEALPQVLQLNTTAYSPPAVAILTQAITNLENVLDNYILGLRKTFTPNAWPNRDLVAHTARTPAETGYKTELVSSPGWPNGVYIWVIVEIPLDGKTAWVPVIHPPHRM